MLLANTHYHSPFPHHRAKVTIENKHGDTALEVARNWGDDLVYAIVYAKYATVPKPAEGKGQFTDQGCIYDVCCVFIGKGKDAGKGKAKGGGKGKKGKKGAGGDSLPVLPVNYLLCTEVITNYQCMQFTDVTAC